MVDKSEHEGTASAEWRDRGEKDPHPDLATRIERAGLALGHMTDDQLANGMFLNYNMPLDPQAIIDGLAYSPICWMQAGKDRIRWLSRKLFEANVKIAEQAQAEAKRRELLEESEQLRSQLEKWQTEASTTLQEALELTQELHSENKDLLASFSACSDQLNTALTLLKSAYTIIETSVINSEEREMFLRSCMNNEKFGIVLCRSKE